MVGNTGSLSVGTSALPTFLQVGGRHGASYVNLERQNDTSVSVTAKGAAADITLRLSVKGAGFVGVNADVRPDTANTKYLGSGSLPWEEAFSRHGLDVRRYAFFCEDHVPYSPAVIDEETGDVLEPEQREEIRLGVRYEELLMLEAALLRRNNNRLKVKMDELMVRVESLETKA